MVHEVVKPEHIAATAAVSLSEQLIEPHLMQKESIEGYKGKRDDAINVVVEGVLPYRSYGWRNDRSQPVQFDEYTEKTVQVKFGGDAYSGVKLTDEQNDFDLPGWAKLAAKQTEAVAGGVNLGAVRTIENAPYEVELGVAANALRSGLIRARATMTRLRAPGRRTLLVGTDWETALLEDEKLNLVQNVGEAEAVSALREAVIGRRYGFDIVVSQTIDPGMAVAMVENAYVFANGAPSTPQSVPFGATASHEGVALRWIRDYDTEYQRDRSLFTTWYGYRNIVDTLVGLDADDQSFVSDHEHFVRAFKLNLDGADSLPDPDLKDEDPEDLTEDEAKALELGNITGLWGNA